MTDDPVYIWINRDDDVQGAKAFAPAVERLDVSFLPAPVQLEVDGGRPRAIRGFRDPAVATALDGGPLSVALSADGLWADLLQLEGRITVSLRFPAAHPADEIRSLFLDLVTAMSPTYGRAHLDGAGQRLYAAHYRGRDRSFYADGLYWLNYFGPDELERQGGERLADNPYANVTWMRPGLLLEVGEGPLDALTAEGEQRLVAASDAMPPLGKERQPVELVTIGGVLGFLDPIDRGFWVSRHVAGKGRLDAATLRRLASLPGQGDPPVGHVHVLFSTQEAAEANQKELAAAGAETWYVDPETGDPRPCS